MKTNIAVGCGVSGVVFVCLFLVTMVYTNKCISLPTKIFA